MQKEEREKEKRREEKHSIKLEFLFHPLLSPLGPREFASIDLQAFETVQRVRVQLWSIAYLLRFAIENAANHLKNHEQFMILNA